MGSILSTHGKKNSPSPKNTTHPRGHDVGDVCWDAGGGWLVAAGGVGSMVVVVVVPHRDGVTALLLSGVGTRVEALLGQDAVVALDLAVVPGGVGAGPLVA